jgi:hypothetical protein
MAYNVKNKNKVKVNISSKTLGLSRELISKMCHVISVPYVSSSETTQSKLSYADNLSCQLQAAWLQTFGNEMEIHFCDKMMKTVSV